MANSSSKESNGRSSTKDSAPTTSKVYKCTVCEKVIKSTYNAHLHPLIDCLVCRTCYGNYGNGDFSSWPEGVDENGDDNYCRWCCDGGELYGCSSDEGCHYCFCQDCIERNAPDDPLITCTDKKMQWFCFACDRSKLAKLREWSAEAMRDLNEREALKENNKSDRSQTNGTPSSRKSDAAAKEPNHKKDSSVRVESTTKKDVPTPRKDAPPPKKDAPQHRRDVPPPKKDVPTPRKDAPPPMKDVPTPMKDAPTPMKDVPTPLRDLPRKGISDNKNESISKVDTTLKSGENNSDSSLHRSKKRKSDRTVEILTETELKARLGVYGKTKVACLGEIDSKFGNLLEMFTSAEVAKNPKRRELICQEIASMRETMMEFDTMLINLENLSYS